MIENHAVQIPGTQTFKKMFWTLKDLTKWNHIYLRVFLMKEGVHSPIVAVIQMTLTLLTRFMWYHSFINFKKGGFLYQMYLW